MKLIEITTNDEINLIESRDVCEDAKKRLNGYIQIVRPSKMKIPYVMLVDDEGLIKDLELNAIGSVFYLGAIVGNVYIVKIDQDDVIGLSDDEVKVFFHTYDDLINDVKKRREEFQEIVRQTGK